ncbi:putative stress-inducible protein [Streptomyces scabiei 87.22]|uniref:Putative stress-inducible protein n=4 Tax=Streptomyces TaxID=1883 RepID=C9YYT0_STRSW|nr:putative stress-inducible protein [Streptomyces scabiei 87.22]
MPGPEGEEAVDLRGLVVGAEVEVQPVLDGLRPRIASEQQSGEAVRGRADLVLVGGVVHDDPAEGPRPPAPEGRRIGRVHHQLLPLQGHTASVRKTGPVSHVTTERWAMTTRPITAAVDGTPESLAALAWAGREAVRRDLALRVVHAWQWEPHEAVAVDREGQARWAEEALAEAARDVRERHSGLAVTTELLQGPPVEILAGVAGSAEALVLGSRGHGAVLGFLLGSVGQQVIVESPCPVVLVRAEDSPAGEAAGREIVVGQQGTAEDSADVLRFAFETAAARGASLRAVRAWALPPLYAYSPGSLKLLDEAGGLEPYEKKALATALEPWRERFPGVPVTEHVEIGSAGQVLLSVAHRAQLMVVGRRARRTAVGARIGSVTHGVLHHAGCPVAVVPHG